LILPNYIYNFDASQSPLGGFKLLEARVYRYAPLDVEVVLFHNIVQVFALSNPDFSHRQQIPVDRPNARLVCTTFIDIYHPWFSVITNGFAPK